MTTTIVVVIAEHRAA